jgi:hypothetical protein
MKSADRRSAFKTVGHDVGDHRGIAPTLELVTAECGLHRGIGLGKAPRHDVGDHRGIAPTLELVTAECGLHRGIGLDRQAGLEQSQCLVEQGEICFRILGRGIIRGSHER